MIRLTRRTAIAAMASVLALQPIRLRAAAQNLRLGVLQFGTVQWIADIIHRHAFDAQQGFALHTVMLANNDAGRVSLMAGASDVVVADWQFVAAQRAAGTKLSFAPFSSASGAIMVAEKAPIHDLADLRGKKLGVAGGPVDKSWLLVQAAARSTLNIDLASTADVVYGAPPLLGAKLQQGELDAVLTFWNFAAKLEAAGFRQAVAVSDCAGALGISPHFSQVGFVFHEDWATANRPLIDGFLTAVDAAEKLLAVGADAEWQAVRPLMDAPDDALFAQLKARFRAGMAHEDNAGQAKAAAALFAVLKQTGGSRATDNMEALPPGIFWPFRGDAS
jgi:NitT/TauT family transport system substrate-binding protein